MRSFKKIMIITIAVLFLSCSVGRKFNTVENYSGKIEEEYSSLAAEVYENNLCKEGFVIKNGRGVTEGLPVNSEFLFNAKVNQKGDFIFSVRGPFAIEIVRIISINDNVYMINRLEKTIYRGSKLEFLNRYKLPGNFIDVFFGDFISKGNDLVYQTKGDRVSIIDSSYSIDNEIIISRTEKKIIKETLSDPANDISVIIEYDKFQIQGKAKYPGIISITEIKRNIKIDIYISNFKSGCYEEMSLELPEYKIVNL